MSTRIIQVTKPHSSRPSRAAVRPQTSFEVRRCTHIGTSRGKRNSRRNLKQLKIYVFPCFRKKYWQCFPPKTVNCFECPQEFCQKNGTQLTGGSHLIPRQRLSSRLAHAFQSLLSLYKITFCFPVSDLTLRSPATSIHIQRKKKQILQCSYLIIIQ